MSEEEAMNRAVRHQIFLEQYTNGQIKKVQKTLKSIEKRVTRRLAREDVTINNRKRYNALLSDVKAILKAEYTQAGNVLIKDMEKLAEVEAKFELASIRADLSVNVQTTLPTAQQLHAAVFAKPLEGRFLTKTVSKWTVTEAERVEAAITEGFFRGTTTQEITREIRGTRANKFKDGILGGQSNRSATAIVRTAVNHTSAQAKMATMKVNDDIVEGWRFVNTLDNRTSLICLSQDTQIVHPIGKGPIPPLHFNCRSTMVHVIKEQFLLPSPRGTTRASVGAEGPTPVPANQTYSTWLRNQPAAFQDAALGKTRGALFRRGDLPVEKFTNDANQVLTLDQLKRTDPLAFEKANIK